MHTSHFSTFHVIALRKVPSHLDSFAKFNVLGTAYISVFDRKIIKTKLLRLIYILFGSCSQWIIDFFHIFKYLVFADEHLNTLQTVEDW